MRQQPFERPPRSLPTPRLVAWDATGAVAGVPAVLMTWLPGRVVWDPKGLTRWLVRLADVLPAIHEGVIADADAGQYANYAQASYEPPAWATNRLVWERAIEIFHGPVLETERCFVHRDFHPGNVLWQRGRVSGVVDWASACLGPPSVDIGHCRANFLGYAPDLADLYTQRAEHATGRSFHRWADIAALIGMLDGLRSHPPRPAGQRAIEPPSNKPWPTAAEHGAAPLIAGARERAARARAARGYRRVVCSREGRDVESLPPGPCTLAR